MTDKKNKNPDELEIIESGDEFEMKDTQEKFTKLKAELSDCRKKAEEYLSGWQRAKADLINGRREGERDREAAAKFANERLVREMLDVVDGLEMALASVTGGPHEEGLNGIYRRMLQILRGYGVSPFEAKGARFSPAEHESVAVEEVNDEAQDDTVLEELQKGYRMHDKVIRPARVKIGHFLSDDDREILSGAPRM